MYEVYALLLGIVIVSVTFSCFCLRIALPGILYCVSVLYVSRTRKAGILADEAFPVAN